ncbi:hypothetical protein OGX66_14145 [Citrobacter sp. Cf072]|uniref:hypothetical protein n=1 Tax=unclassified Citrobacter TaxID=2644389 RepID=UPI00257603AF|nr:MULTISPECIES: hypothetical protein [unclassified Citrobacter]MDM3091572.1 hypothetical protein [Citrobacter sp. Cf136]MDM3251316.1 hypothetical protein [Citrobacter sp. Cf072]
MSIFANEDEMQEWMEERLEEVEGLHELILNTDDISNFLPTNTPEQKIKDSFISCLNGLHITNVISKNENISNKKGDVLKPDILAYAPEKEAIVIIELKNFGNATREAGTELSAYAAEVKTSLDHLSDGDIISIIVSPKWPTLIKHHLYNAIVWQNKNILCLEPLMKGDDIFLKVVDIQTLVQGIPPEKFSEQQLAAYTICLYDDTQQSRTPPPTKLHGQLPLMLASIDTIATKGEKINSHGFAFLSKENLGFGLSPYFIHVVSIAPFKCLERILHTNEISTYDDLPKMTKKYIDIYMEHSPYGYGSNMDSIIKTSLEFLNNICSPHIEGLTTWEIIKEGFDSLQWEPLYFTSWGLFKDIAINKLGVEYCCGNTSLNINSVKLGLDVVNETIDVNHRYIEIQSMHESFFPEGYFDD